MRSIVLRATLVLALTLGTGSAALAQFPPGAFDKLTPADGATGVSTLPTLTWQTSSGATYYEVCLDTTADDACSTEWVNVGNVTSVTSPTTLAYGTTYYWQEHTAS